MNQADENKIVLYQQQKQLQKQLKTKKDMIARARRTYITNKKIAQDNMELIKQLTEMQKSYYEAISTPPPLSDSKKYQYHLYRNLIDDLEKSYKEIEESTELAFPFDEDISPNIDQYSDLYNQLDNWLQKKEIFIEEGDEQQKSIKKEIERLKQQNSQLRNLIESEPDISDQIIKIKNIIKEKKAILIEKDEIISTYQQKQKELAFINDSIEESQKNQESNENSESSDEDIKIDEEVNVQTLSKLQLKLLNKWEELRKTQIERQNQKEKMNEFVKYIKNFLKT